MAAAPIQFDEKFAKNLLSKNYVLLRLLFKCGCNKSAATNTVITVFGLDLFIMIHFLTCFKMILHLSETSIAGMAISS